MKTIVLLTIANVFMTLAWYGHLKFLPAHNESYLRIILISWGIAFFEYCFQVPANRIGYGQFSATELKIIQEVVSISVFLLFAILILGERMRWNHLVAFLLIACAVYFATRVSP